MFEQQIRSIQWLVAGSLVMAVHGFVWLGIRSFPQRDKPIVFNQIEVELVMPPQLFQVMAASKLTPMPTEPKRIVPLASSQRAQPPPPSKPVERQPEQLTSATPSSNVSVLTWHDEILTVPKPLSPAPSSEKPVVSALPEESTPPRFNAAYLDNPTPAYPRAARRAGYEGTVIVQARIQVDGNADRAEIKNSSGYRALDQAALEAVRKWRFIPAKRGNEAIMDWVEIPLTFRLESE